MHDELLDYVTILHDTNNTRFDLTIIDLSDKTTFQAGHIPHALNIEIDRILDTNGYIVNDAKVLTLNFERDQSLLFYSSSNDTVEYTVAKLAEYFEYQKIYYYEGGKQEWHEVYGNSLWIEYPAFYDYQMRNLNHDSSIFIVDVHPESWFNGEEYLQGHIPGAINIPVEQLVDYSKNEFSLSDSGKTVSSVIPQQSSTIVLYDSKLSGNKAIDFANALKIMGYKSVFLFREGYENWIENGQSVVCSSAEK
jgi:3-mercaptopyruvate sulfurtransferase SseA